MIERVRFWWAQRRIHRSMDDISRAHGDAVKKAKASGANAETVYELGHGYHSEHTLAEDELSSITSAYYRRLADRLLIPVPEFKEEGGGWIESEIGPGRFHLTPKALTDLRSAIRMERKERREEWTVWITLLVGVIGALIGLVAVLCK